MLTAIEQFDLSQILQPVQRPEDARQDALKWGANLTITRGQAVGIKTSDKLAYPFNIAASDGTQKFVGLAMYTFKTDASGLVFYGASATSSARLGPWATSPIWCNGIFDPQDLTTGATGVAVAEVDTFTPSNPTTGDLYTVYYPGGSVTATIGATQTATAATTLLKAAWNADANAVAYATASGTATFILTGVSLGSPLVLSAGVIGTGTIAKVVTTAAANLVQGEVDTFTPANPTTADVYTLTATFPDASTQAANFTIGATQTATAASAGLIAAWNAIPSLAAIATASGTATVILTAVNVGNSLSVAGSVVGTGTISKVTTTPAVGRNIADIQASRPGAYVMHNGFWRLP